MKRTKLLKHKFAAIPLVLLIMLSSFSYTAVCSDQSITAASSAKTGILGLLSPNYSDGWYTIENNKFGIDGTGKYARATTDGINEALTWASENGYNKVRLAKGTYLIQCTWYSPFVSPYDGVLVPSNMVLDLRGATLVLESNSQPGSCIIALTQVSNTTIIGGTLIGDRYTHHYTTNIAESTHEWGFGINISACKNILICGVTIKETTGDGIIVGGSYRPLSAGGKMGLDIRIINCEISNCRRLGISVVAGSDITIAGNEISYISGTVPQYGIDIEPAADYIVNDLYIYNNVIHDCKSGAICCHGGKDYQVFSNTCIGNNILAVACSNVDIHNNNIETSEIKVFYGCTDVQVYNNNLDAESWIYIAN